MKAKTKVPVVADVCAIHKVNICIAADARSGMRVRLALPEQFVGFLRTEIVEGRLYGWYVVSDAHSSYRIGAREFVIIATGEFYDANTRAYQGTFRDDEFVWHLFEVRA